MLARCSGYLEVPLASPAIASLDRGHGVKDPLHLLSTTHHERKEGEEMETRWGDTVTENEPVPRRGSVNEQWSMNQHNGTGYISPYIPILVIHALLVHILCRLLCSWHSLRSPVKG